MLNPPFAPSSRPRLLELLIIRGVLALALIIAVPAISQAAMYYISPSGNDSNTGLSPSTPWRTIAKANSALRGGDAVRVSAGSYSDRIQPSVGGTSTSARVTYIGDMANPTNVNVAGFTINVPYVTVKGFNGGGVALNYPARYDSIAYCVFSGMTQYGNKYCMIARNIINGGLSYTYDGGLAAGGTSNCERDTLRGNRITSTGISPNHFFKVRGNAQHCLVDSNQVFGTFYSGTVDGIGRLLYNCNNFTFRDNKWTFEATAAVGVGQWRAFSMRDSANGHVFERDTVLAGLNSPHAIAGVMGSSGTFGQVRNNTWDGCVYKTNSYFYNEDRLVNVTIRNSVFASASDATFLLYDVLLNCTIDHNTFFSGGAQAFRWDFTQPANSGTRVNSNIFYSRSAASASSGGGVVLFGNNSGWTQNNNVYFTPTFTSTPGDRSIVWCCFTGSRPGTGQPWFNATGNDGQSSYGSPMFQDSLFANFDAHLRSNSLARGKGAGGTDAGAYPYGTGPGPDVTPPAQVSDLRSTLASDQIIVLAWTAPGDDGMTGQAQTYDLRWSNSPITSGNFGSATPVTIQPIPLFAGQAQSYVMTGLTPATTYYFAIKAVDSTGNWSAMSNAPAIPTTAGDQAAPDSIKDLATQP